MPSRSTGEPGDLRESARPRPSQCRVIAQQPGFTLYRAGPLRRRRAAPQASLAISEKALGPDHPDVASSLNNLAELYKTQGRYADAEPLYKRAWRSARRRSAPTIPMSRHRSNNLARLYRRPRPLRRCRAALQASLAIREKALGPDHPDVAQRARTTWLCSTRTKAATPTPSRSTGERWRSARKRSAPTIPMSRHPQQSGSAVP